MKKVLTLTIDLDACLPETAKVVQRLDAESLTSTCAETRKQAWGLLPIIIDGADRAAHEVTITEHWGWSAGWNMPGYMPESEPARFDTFAQAVDYLIDELEMQRESNGGAIYGPAIDKLQRALQNDPDNVFATVGKYVWWVAREQQ